jgi:hypothetical protein
MTSSVAHGVNGYHSFRPIHTWLASHLCGLQMTWDALSGWSHGVMVINGWHPFVPIRVWPNTCGAFNCIKSVGGEPIPPDVLADAMGLLKGCFQSLVASPCKEADTQSLDSDEFLDVRRRKKAKTAAKPKTEDKKVEPKARVLARSASAPLGSLPATVGTPPASQPVSEAHPWPPQTGFLMRGGGERGHGPGGVMRGGGERGHGPGGAAGDAAERVASLVANELRGEMSAAVGSEVKAALRDIEKNSALVVKNTSGTEKHVKQLADTFQRTVNRNRPCVGSG